MNIHELKQKHPRMFDKAYMEWVCHIDHYWYTEPVKTDFITNMKSLGLTVETIYFDQQAAVDATMSLTKFMEQASLTTKYYPLYLAAINEDSIVTFKSNSRNCYQLPPDVNFHASSYVPVGMFSDLSQEAWNELIDNQIDAEDWSKLALNWIHPYLSQLMRDLDDAYDYESSEENFINVCEANEYQFDENGEMI